MNDLQQKARREVCRIAARLLRQLSGDLWQHRPDQERAAMLEAVRDMVLELECRGKGEWR